MATITLAQPSEEWADSIWRTYQLEDVVVTAQYAPTHYQNALHPVKVITARDMKAQGQNNLAEVLTNQLNLRVSADPILGNGLSIQGIGGENVQIMIDGVPIIGRVNGNVDLSQVNLQRIERIEIITGAMSAQYGSNAAGGVINLITKKSQLNRWQLEGQHQWEDIGNWNNALTVGARLGQFHASLTGSYNHSQLATEDSLRLYQTVTLPSGDSYRTKVNPWNPKEQYGLDGMLRFRPTDSVDLTYQYRYFDEDLVSYGELRRPQFQPYAFDETYRTLRQDHQLQATAYLGSQFYLNSTTAYNDYAREKLTERLDMETGSREMVPGGQDTIGFTAWLHRTSLSTLAKGAWNGQVGLEWYRETGKGDRIVDSTAAPYDQANMSNYALWGSLRFQPVSTFTVEANLRYGYNTRYDHPLIPAIHLRWQPVTHWQWRLSYAHGFRAPSLKELYFNFIDVNHFIVGNLDLEAEYSQNATLTTDYQWTLPKQQQLRTEVQLFYNQIRNRIVLAEYAPLEYNYQNLDRYTTFGSNLRLAYSYGQTLRLQSGLAWTHLYNDWSADFSTDKYLDNWEMMNELQLRDGWSGLQLTVTHRYIGRQVTFQQDSEGNLLQGSVGDYHLVNATLSRDLWEDRIFLAVGAKNLFDTQTVPITGVSSGSAHASSGGSRLLNWGRTFFVRLNYTF